MVMVFLVLGCLSLFCFVFVFFVERDSEGGLGVRLR